MHLIEIKKTGVEMIMTKQCLEATGSGNDDGRSSGVRLSFYTPGQDSFLISIEHTAFILT